MRTQGNSDPPLVFVYGSLMSGQQNHQLMAGASFHGTGNTLAEYTLYDSGPWPLLVHSGCTEVVGELYHVSPNHRSFLDRFEGHPSHFFRTLIQLRDGRQVECWLLRKTRLVDWPEITSGDWRQRNGIQTAAGRTTNPHFGRS